VVTENSKEENSEDFCPKYVKEFGLCTALKKDYIERNPNPLLASSILKPHRITSSSILY
jgi:hypothetical protein